MLPDVLPLVRPLISIDLETTGTVPKIDRIVEIGICKLTPEGTYTEWTTYVNPGIQIPREASIIHRVTTEKVNSCKLCGGSRNGPLSVRVQSHRPDYPDIVEDYGQCTCENFSPWPTFRSLAVVLAQKLTDVDLCGYNLYSFDVKCLEAEFERNNVRWKPAHILDGYRIWTRFIPRNLTNAVEFYLGEKLEGAHGALPDARAALRVVYAQLIKHPELPRDVEQMHKMFFETVKDGALDPDGILIWRNKEACLGFGKKHNGKTLREVKALDPNYLKWMIKEDFSAVVKKIVEEALVGKFPTQ